MKPRTDFSKKTYSFFVFFILLGLLVWQFSPQAESAAENQLPKELVNYDIRTDKSETAKKAIENFVGESANTESLIALQREKPLRAERSLRDKIPNLKIEYNEDLRIPEVISPDITTNAEFLTAKSGEKRSDVLKNFIRENSELFGIDETQISQLKLSADYTNPNGVLSFAHFEQKIDDVPVFRGEVKAGFTKNGEITRIINNLAPNLNAENISKDFGSAETAVINAAKYINRQANESDTKQISADNLKVTFERGQFADATTAEKMYFPIDSGVARTAWRVLLWTKNEAYYVIVDAQNGTLLWRKNITESQTQTATYNVYGNATSLMKTADSPSPFTPGCLAPTGCAHPSLIPRTSFTLVGNEPPYNFNNNGWIPDGENRTIGNAAEAGIDRDGTNGIDPNGWAFGNPNRNFVYTYNPAPGNPAPGEEPLPSPQTYPPSQYQQGSITHAFYAINRWHDETYLLGFNEQSRNFQTNNFGRGGVGNDSISVEIQDSSGTNSANFATPADGVGMAKLQMFIWTGATPDRDGALDSQIFIHEATHGMSNRLHGNASGLSTNMSRGMGEGWSDFYALALLSEPNDARLGTFPLGGYATYQLTSGFESNYYYGIRRLPVAVWDFTGDGGCRHNPLTFADIDSTQFSIGNACFPRSFGSSNADQVHNLGETWAVTLWEVRDKLIQRHGPAEGNRRVLQYVTDGMKLAPLNPTFLQSRDAILASAQINDPNDAAPVWAGFAIRGLGTGATIQNIGSGANNTRVTESFAAPSAPNVRVRADFDGDGKTDLSVFRSSEGNWYLNRSASGFSAVNWGISSDRLVPGDYDGDNKTDTAVYRNGNWYVLRSGNSTFSSIGWGLSSDIPVAGDFDGDNKTDAAVFRPSNGNWFILKSSNGQFTAAQFGQAGDIPMSGDFDGDSKNDYAVYRSGMWYLQRSTAGFTAISFGLLSDDPVPADYDGDGKDDIAVFRFTEGVWYRLNSSNGQFAAVTFGQDGDIPVPGDYDGDGKYDQAVYRNGNWYLNRSTGGFSAASFGLSSDQPIPKQYIP